MPSQAQPPFVSPSRPVRVRLYRPASLQQEAAFSVDDGGVSCVVCGCLCVVQCALCVSVYGGVIFEQRHVAAARGPLLLPSYFLLKKLELPHHATLGMPHVAARG